jgi:hypothetical protein
MVKETKVDFDVIIVGSGPAGIFTAYELNKDKPDLEILLLDQGRRRTIDDTTNNLFGWGGAGAFSDGKLTLTSKTGGQLVERGYLTEEEFERYMRYVESLYEKFGGKQEIKIGNEKKITELVKRAKAAGLELIPYPVKHWGREGAFQLVENLYKYLKRKGVTIRLNSEVVSIEKNSDKWGVVLKNGKRFWGDCLILATGRAGADWTVKELEKHGVETENNPVDAGVRVETEKIIPEELTDNLYDFKLRYRTHERGDKVRTFCVCPGGKVIKEQHSDFTAVNGQTDKNSQTNNTNFAILVSMPFTEPFKDANAYGRYIARLGTLLADGSVMVQTLADWKNARRSKPSSLEGFSVKPTLKEAAPGDLRGLALTERFFAGINEMLQALGRFIPGLDDGNNVLLYGIEVKLYSKRVVFEDGFETKARRLCVVGDGSGITRGLLQSTIMGIKAARDLIKKYYN